MGKKLVTAQPAFTMLVPNITAPTDPSMTPGVTASKAAVDNGTPLNVAPTTVYRDTYRSQYFPDVPGKGPNTQPTTGETPGTRTRLGLLTYETGQTPVTGKVDLTVDSNTFNGPTFLQFGQYRAELGADVAIGGTLAVTADNLAAFIDGTPEWACAATGTGTIRVNGPKGIVGSEVEIYATGISPGNFTILTLGGESADGRMHDAQPEIGPPVLS